MSVNNSDYKNEHSGVLLITLDEYNHIKSVKLTIITILVNKNIYIDVRQMSERIASTNIMGFP